MKSENKRIVASFAVTPQMKERLKEYKKENGVSRSWLINKLLTDYFAKVGGKKNGEQ